MKRQRNQILTNARADIALTLQTRLVHRGVLAAFIEAGRAPGRRDLEHLARDTGTDLRAVLGELADRDLIALDERGELRAAYPFSPAPTAIRVTWPGGPAAYAMCAIDALGMSAMLDRPVTITATEPGSGQLIAIDVDHHRARWRPRRAVVFAGTIADCDACCPSVDRSCGHINFFTRRRAARAWASDHPDITGTILSRRQALRWGIAEFGALLHQPHPADQDPP